MSIQQFKPGEQPARVPRGSACLSCRRRKMRCDGNKPVCGQCVHMDRAFDCEFTDGPTPSPTQILERHVARLEARIRELEHADPQARPGPSRQVSQPQSGAPSRAKTPGGTPPTAEPVISPDPKIEPHVATIRLLVSIFVPHASQVGFFLNLSRFLDIVYLPDVNVRRRVLSCALLDVVLLWGAHLSTNDSIRTYESTFLTRAVKSVLEALPLISSRQHNAVHVIQAEILLANYFFCQARSLEGTYHCSAAVALALSCRLNHRHGRGSPQMAGPPSGFTLAPTTDAIESTERTNAFWAAYILDRTWTVASGPLPNDVFTGVQITAPWPVDSGSHEQRVAPQGPNNDTVQGFLHNPTPGFAVDGLSPLALRAKAAALFERATRVASQITPGNIDNIYVEFHRLDNIMKRFTEALLPLNRPEVAANPEAVSSLLVTHTYVRVAMIRLYSSHDASMPNHQGADLAAARQAAAILDGVRFEDLPFLDPALGMLWTTVCQVLATAVGRLGNNNSRERQSLLNSLQRVVSAMGRYRTNSALMASQYALVQQNLARMNLTGV